MVVPTSDCTRGSSSGLYSNPLRASFIDVSATGWVGEWTDIGCSKGIGEGEGGTGGRVVGVGDCGGGWGGGYGMVGECWRRGGGSAGDGVTV